MLTFEINILAEFYRLLTGAVCFDTALTWFIFKRIHD